MSTAPAGSAKRRAAIRPGERIEPILSRRDTPRNGGGAPIADRAGAVFAVAQLLNKRGGAAFDAEDERRFAAFTRSLGVVLESWVRMASNGRGS